MPISKKPIITLFGIVFLDLLGFGLIIPLLPYYAIRFNASPVEITLLASIYSFFQFLAAPLLGAFSDKYGRKPVLIFSQFGSALGFIILALSTVIVWSNPTHGLIALFISRIIDGISAGNIAVAQTYASDITGREGKSKAMGLLGAAFGLGFAFGPGIGGILGHINPAYPGFLAAFLCLSAAFSVHFFLPESNTNLQKVTHYKFPLTLERLKLLFQDQATGSICLIWFFAMFGYVMLEPIIPLLLHDYFGYGAREAGLFFLAVGIVIIFVQGGLVGRLSKKFGDKGLAFTGGILASLGTAGYAYVAFNGPFNLESSKHLALTFLIFLGSFALVNAVGRSLQTPTLLALLSHSSKGRSEGAVYGVYQGGASLARVMGPALAGILYERSVGLMFLTATFFVSLAALITYLKKETFL